MSRSTNGRRDAANGKGAPSSTDAPFVFERAAAKWKGYVNIDQSEASKKQYANYAADSNLVAEIVAALPVRGYKLSVVCDGTPEVYKATAYAAYRGMPDEGIAVSAWAGSLWDAVAAVAFIVIVQCQADLSPYYQASDSMRRFTF